MQLVELDSSLYDFIIVRSVLVWNSVVFFYQVLSRDSFILVLDDSEKN